MPGSREEGRELDECEVHGGVRCEVTPEISDLSPPKNKDTPESRMVNIIQLYKLDIPVSTVVSILVCHTGNRGSM